MYRVRNNVSSSKGDEPGCKPLPFTVAQELLRMKRQLCNDGMLTAPPCNKHMKYDRTFQISGQNTFAVASNGQSVASGSPVAPRELAGDTSLNTSVLATRMKEHAMTAASTHNSVLGTHTTSFSFGYAPSITAMLLCRNKDSVIPLNPPNQLPHTYEMLHRATNCNNVFNAGYFQGTRIESGENCLPRLASCFSAQSHTASGTIDRSNNDMLLLTRATLVKEPKHQETTVDNHSSGDSTSCQERSQLSLPATLWHPGDDRVMNEHQVLLRKQIEVFVATEMDAVTHTRGRNKRIRLGQVGIRCRHCAHFPIMQRPKGSTYFPASTLGLYQAAQNMSSTHIQCGLCPAMPESLNMEFVRLIPSKKHISGAGRVYWAQRAKQLGLVDTENDGIGFYAGGRA